MAKSPDRKIYRVLFQSQGKVVELYCNSVSQGDLFGFVLIEELLFGERSQVVVDPSEENLKREFEGVHRFHVPMHSVLRIDEVEKEGAARVRDGEAAADNLSVFPTGLFTPGPRGKR